MATLTGSRCRVIDVNRRTLLGAAGGLSAFGLVSYFIYEFSLSIPVLITAENETDRTRGLVVEGYEQGTERQLLESSVTIQPDVSTQIGRVPNTDARITVDLVDLGEESEPDEGAVRASDSTFVNEDTKGVTIKITDEGLTLELEYRESAAGDQSA